MSGAPRKASFCCPHCGFVQHEPAHLISTYCRACGAHYEVAAAQSPGEQLEKSGESLVNQTLRRIISKPPRQVHCYLCGQNHAVSGYARSTICPGCSASIELGDLVFSSNVSRPVDTRGKLTVQAEGYLNSSRIICGSALIQGRIAGTLRCEGEVRLACSGKVGCQILANTVRIEKNSQVELAHLLETNTLVILGRAVGRIRCNGNVTIKRTGRLEGILEARSVTVERGGVLLGQSSIHPFGKSSLPEISPGSPETKSGY